MATTHPATADTSRPAATARSRLRPRPAAGWSTTAARLGLLAVLLGLWQLAAGRWIDEFFISRPTAVADILWQWITAGELWYHASSTFQSAATGFLLGGAAAIVTGYLLGGAPRVAAVVEPFITAIYSLPKLALVPLFIMWFGIGRPLQVGIAALVTFFLMFYNTFFGVADVDRHLVDSVRIMGGGRWDIATRVRLPSALVWVVAGLKIAIPQALVAVVVAEMLASNRGLGHLVAVNAGQFNSSGTFAALTVLLVIGVAVDRLVGLATRRALLWKQAAAPGD